MTMIARRTFLATGAGAGAVALGITGRASARVAPAGKQVPGVHRFRIGTFELTVMSSGTLSFPIEELWPAIPKEEVAAVLAADFQPTDMPVLQVNVLAVNTGDRLVLIDTGSGGKFFDTAGRLSVSLAAAGIRPEDVDTVVFTHAHPDHLFGATDTSGARRLFPNAEHVITDVEWDFWTAPDRAADLSEDWWREMVRLAQENLRAAEPRLRRIKAGGEVVPGIMSIDTSGHTPGHISLHIVSGSDELICTGDAVGNRAVSFQKPDWRGGYDMDLDQGARTRRAFLDRCATDKVLVASYHLPFPGVGHVARDGTAFRWVPADWRWDM